MTKTSKTIIFFGNERLVSGLSHTTAPTLTGLISAGYKIGAIVSHHSESRSRNQRPLEVADIAKQHGITLLLPNKPIEVIEELKNIDADIAVLSSYGRIIPQEIIDIFPGGIVNIHPSLLPKYRGPTPIESTILAGDSVAGVSIMQLTAKMDAGPIFTQRQIALQGNEDKFALYDKLSALGAATLLEVLPEILNGALVPQPQNETEATYCYLLTKEAGALDPATMTAEEAERKVRAFLNFPKTKITIYNQVVTVTRAHVANEEKGLSVRFSDGGLLIIDELIGANGRRMSGQDFKNGYAAG